MEFEDPVATEVAKLGTCTSESGLHAAVTTYSPMTVTDSNGQHSTQVATTKCSTCGVAC